jgi:hypothetical protein
MGDANLTENPDSLDAEYRTKSTVASVAIGRNLCDALIELSAPEAKLLFAVAYFYAVTSKPLVGSLSDIADRISLTKGQTRHAIASLTLSHKLRTERARDAHSLMPGDDYRIQHETKVPRTKRAQKKHTKEDGKIVPFDQEGCLVRLLPSELNSLITKFGDVQACHLIDSLDDYLKANPRKNYTSHYLTILNWDRMAREKGKVFVIAHPRLGTGYIPEHVARQA